MKAVKIAKVCFVGLLGSSMLLMGSCSSKQKKTDSTNVKAKTEQVKTLILKPTVIDRNIEYTSTLKAWEEVHLAPATPGRIEKIMVEVSNVVNKGQVLVQMDKTQLLQTELQLKNLETEYKRAQILFDAGSYSAQAYDQLKTQYEVAKTNVDYLRTNTALRAPFTGVISGKYFENGEMYSGTPIATVGKAAVLSIVKLDILKAIISVPESYFPMVSKAMSASVISDIYPEKIFKGMVNIVYPVVDPTTRTFDVEIKIDNKNKVLRPGLFARVSLHFGKASTMVVPDYAVLKMQGSNERYMFIVENGKAKRIVVSIGTRLNDKLEIISDQLKEGDEVVVAGQARLLDGVSVNVIK
ncbi:MAG: efflux RND transporter periplasmic adaptor subunit [Bacteroidales bacterium]